MRRGGENAFTLIELLVVILVLGILLAIAAPSFLGQQSKAYDSKAQQDLTISYKEAKAVAASNGGTNFGAPGTLAAYLQTAEPQLGVVYTSANTGAGIVTTNSVYVVTADSSGNLVLAELSKSGAVQILKVSADGAPVYASNMPPSSGSGILFSHWDAAGIWSVWSMSASGASPAQLVPNGGDQLYSASWSPDGTKVSYQDGSANKIYVASWNGSGSTQVASNASNPGASWSPDGTKVVYACSTGLCTVNSDGSGQTTVLSNSGCSCNYMEPAYSPDGAKIVFASNQPGYGCTQNPCIFQVNADGSNFHIMSTGGGEWPTYNPAGTKIAYDDNYSSAGIWTMNSDGTSPARVSGSANSGIAPAWSPDGSAIAYSVSGVSVDTISAAGGSNAAIYTGTAENLESGAWR